MKQIDVIKDDWGEDVIRVFKCDKFQKIANDIPIFISKNLHNSEDVKNLRICDIIQQVENYLE